MSEPEKEIEEASEAEEPEKAAATEEKAIEGEKGEIAEAEEEEALTEEAAGEEETTSEETALEEEAKEEPAAKEEAEKPKPKEKEEDIVEEKFYTIPLRRVWIMPPKKRAPRAIRIIKGFVEKHMKIGVTEKEEEAEEEKEERLIISSELNEKIWSRGIEKPPRRIKVRVVKDSEGNVTVYPVKGD